MNRPPRTALSEKNLLYRGVPREYFDARLDQYEVQPDILETITRYTGNLNIMLEDNVSLIFYGMNGNGKTYLSCIIVKEAYRYRYTSFRITLQALIQLYFNRSKDSSYQEKWEDILDCDFLVIDEIGKEAFDSKQYNIAIFEEVLRHRDTIGKPTIKCTNLPLEEQGGLYDQYGKSIRSLIEGKAVKLEFIGDDYRKVVTGTKRGIHVLMGGEPYEEQRHQQ